MKSINPNSKFTNEIPFDTADFREILPTEDDVLNSANLSIEDLRAALIKERDYQGYIQTLPGFGRHEFLYRDQIDKVKHPLLSTSEIAQITEDFTVFRLELLKAIKNELNSGQLNLALEKTLEHELLVVYGGRPPSYGLGAQCLQEILGCDSDEAANAIFRANYQSNYALIKCAEYGIKVAYSNSKNKLQNALDNFLGARDILWVSFLPLGYKIANQFIKQKRCSYLDLNFYRASELGILGGVYCYNPTVSSNVKSYMIVRALASCRAEYKASAVHHLKHSQFLGQKSKIAKAEQAFLKESPLASADSAFLTTLLKLSEDNIATLAGMTPASLAAYKANEKVELLSYHNNHSDDEKRDLIPLLSDDKITSPLDYAQKQDLKDIMNSALAFLKPADSQLIKLRYLLDAPLTQKEVASKLGVTHQAISLREIRALEKFKSILKSLGAEEFLNS